MSYSIIKADIKEYKEVIISLWRRNFQEIKEARYPWIYENDLSRIPICYLLKHDDSNSVVGAISLFPRSMYVNGKKIKAYICGDLVVDQKHRTLGPALFLFKAAISKCEENSSSILISFPIKISEVVALRAGFEVLGEYVHMTRMIRTFNYVMRYVNIPLFARLISYPLDLLLYCREMVLFQTISNNTQVGMLECADERFNDFGKKIVNNFSFKGEVSRFHLNWRFHDSPYGSYKIFTISEKDKKSVCGYIVFCMVKNRAHIVDFSFDNIEKSLDILFSSFSRYEKTQGVESITLSVVGSQKLIDQLKKNGYMLRSKETKVLIYAPSVCKEWISEMKSGIWYLTSGDNDV